MWNIAYIMTPFDFVNVGMSRHQTVKVNIRSLTDFLRIKRRAQTDLCLRHVCGCEGREESERKKEFNDFSLGSRAPSAVAAHARNEIRINQYLIWGSRLSVQTKSSLAGDFGRTPASAAHAIDLVISIRSMGLGCNCTWVGRWRRRRQTRRERIDHIPTPLCKALARTGGYVAKWSSIVLVCIDIISCIYHYVAIPIQCLSDGWNLWHRKSNWNALAGRKTAIAIFQLSNILTHMIASTLTLNI